MKLQVDPVVIDPQDKLCVQIYRLIWMLSINMFVYTNVSPKLFSSTLNKSTLNSFKQLTDLRSLGSQQQNSLWTDFEI